MSITILLFKIVQIFSEHSLPEVDRDTLVCLGGDLLLLLQGNRHSRRQHLEQENTSKALEHLNNKELIFQDSVKREYCTGEKS